MAAQDTVSIDFVMADRVLEWLELADRNVDLEALKAEFLLSVMPTEGARVLLKHCSRREPWTGEKLCTFVLESLGYLPIDELPANPHVTDEITALRRELWCRGVSNRAMLRADLARLRQARPEVEAIRIAQRYLPAGTDVTNRFFVIAFGVSNAFSIGNENGLDLLQLPRAPSGEIDLEDLTLLLAHEMHHSGFLHSIKKGMPPDTRHEPLSLVGFLAAEGMPTWFINRMPERLDVSRARDDLMSKGLVADWERHRARLPDLYAEVQSDIRGSLLGEIGETEIHRTWMSGFQGPAYVVGADMFATIEAESGVGAAVEVASDYRSLLAIYNRAAERANRQGARSFVFANDLVQAVSEFTG